LDEGGSFGGVAYNWKGEVNGNTGYISGPPLFD
jgi:hypothetical protein